MASSRKRPSGDLVAEAGRFLGSIDLRGKRLAVGLSGGVDSVTLLHILKNCAARSGFSLNAIHVHHGLSRNAGAWARFCRALCTRWGVPLAVRRVKVAKGGKGLEAAAREARYRAFRNSPCDAVALAHNRDDQAETVLMNLLRGTGVRGASGMPPRSRLDGKMLKQLTSGGARIMVEHDGMRLRVFRGKLALAPAAPAAPFAPVEWKGEPRITIPALGGKLLFRRARGEGIDLRKLGQCRVAVRLRAGGERLQPDRRRPRRTLKDRKSTR